MADYGRTSRGVEGAATLPSGASGWSPEEPLKRAAELWYTSPALQKDPHWNRQFVAQFAVFLVQQFRTEEEQLFRARAPQRERLQRENRQLVLHLRDLLADLERGLEVTPRIQQFLDAWWEHQAGLAPRTEAAGHSGH